MKKRVHAAGAAAAWAAFAALSACAGGGSTIAVDADRLAMATAQDLSRMFGRDPDFVAREGGTTVRRYDFSGCAMLFYFEGEDSSAPVRAVTASTPAGPTEVEDCLKARR